jgi:hypothetical protein
MIKMENPWENISFDSKRRIDSKIPFNFFWVADIEGRFGFFIKATRSFSEISNIPNIKGITVIKRNSEDNFGELILLLNDNNNWQLFFKICTDLLDISSKYVVEDEMIIGINNRLKRWQAFLKENNEYGMSLTKQMGLFAELMCLKKHLIPSLGLSQSIQSWVGPDFDKQDFSFNNILIEVKSYISSKGPIISISSLHQLNPNNKKLFLFTFGLTISDSGFSIINLIGEIEQLFNIEQTNDTELFRNKLALYGYIEGFTDLPFFKFIVDKTVVFTVNDEFPRILPNDVKSQIVSVSYSIDTFKCQKFEVEAKSVFNPIDL